MEFLLQPFAFRDVGYTGLHGRLAPPLHDDGVCEKLVVQKDSQARKQLASISGTPRQFLENLVDDEDPDVAREAQSLLDAWDDEEDDD